PPRRRFGTTSALESACLAVVLARTIEDGCPVVHQRAGRGERLAARAGADIALMGISELLAREGAVVADRLIEHAHMRRDAMLINQPAEHLAGPDRYGDFREGPWV